MKYNKGDRVIGISKHAAGKDIVGLKGTVIEIISDHNVCVEFDKDIDGHNCAGMGKKNHCWWVDGIDCLKKISQEKIVITTDDKKVLARLYEGNKVIKTSTAVCAPDDTFNFETGAEIAFDRLFGKEAQKEANPEPIKIEIGKKYILKPYNEVKDPMGLSEYTWEEIRKRYVVVEDVSSDIYGCDTCYHGRWVFVAEAFEREYIEENKAEPNTELKVGDLVKVIDSGERYSSYTRWLTKNAPQLEKHHAKDSRIENGDWGVIRAIAPHGECDGEKTVCAIELPKNKVFIIGAKGLEKLS